MSSYPLCRLAALRVAVATTFDHQAIGEFFVIFQDNDVFAYRNQCPHTGAPLNWLPGQFLDQSGHYIQCSGHDALFRIDDGYCLAGPCNGQSLSPVPVVVVDDGEGDAVVYLKL